VRRLARRSAYRGREHGGRYDCRAQRASLDAVLDHGRAETRATRPVAFRPDAVAPWINAARPIRFKRSPKPSARSIEFTFSNT